MFAFTTTFTACDFEDEWSPYKSSASIDASMVTFLASTLSGTTTGNPEYTWQLTVTQGSDFCRAITPVGFVGNPFSVKFTQNDGNTARTAKVCITFSDGYTREFSIRQLTVTKNPNYDRAWAEQPEYREGVSLIHKTYYTKLSNGSKVRNFSVCYDTDKMCSRWVAYPSHTSYTSPRDYQVGGSTAGRTNAWAYDDAVTQYKYSSNWNTAFEIISKYVASIDTYDTYTDPIIPQSKQANIRSNIGGGYARGHMLPSADRYNTWNTNAQTCYSTNIMAQDYDLNGKETSPWYVLENKARNKRCADTLFVVVGTLFESSKTVSNNGREVSVPSRCYKLLLRTKKGNTGKHISDITSADELMCIGFLFDNKSSGADASLSSTAVSVSEIERLSGFTFFRNLNPAIAEKVKAQKNFDDWNF